MKEQLPMLLGVLAFVLVLVAVFLLVPADKAPFLYQFF